MARAFPKGTRIIGAGMCVIEPDRVSCFGKSESLDARMSELDEQILYLFLVKGMDALQVSNVVILGEIENMCGGDVELTKTLKKIFASQQNDTTRTNR